MDTIDFELLLKKDRNWLSKYGGFISLLIICALITGVIWIKIPEYKDATLLNGQAIVEVNKNYFNATIGDRISMSNESVKEHTFVIDAIKVTTDKEIFYIKNTTNTTVADGNFRFIVRERSLLESLVSPFIKK